MVFRAIDNIINYRSAGGWQYSDGEQGDRKRISRIKVVNL